MSAHATAQLITVGDVRLAGDLTVPETAAGVVLFAHGSGSSRHSPRNRAVAETFQRQGLATVLLDLLTTDEEQRDALHRQWRFDIELLAGRLAVAVDWIRAQPNLADLPIGLFGASTGAAAALVAAAALTLTPPALVARAVPANEALYSDIDVSYRVEYRLADPRRYTGEGRTPGGEMTFRFILTSDEVVRVVRQAGMYRVTVARREDAGDGATTIARG